MFRVATLNAFIDDHFMEEMALGLALYSVLPIQVESSEDLTQLVH
jgi:hypothetical protein